MLVFSSLFLLGCQRVGEEKNPKGSVKVAIPQYSETTQKYEMQVTELVSVQEFTELKGWAAQFILTPSQEGDKLTGLAPRIKTAKNKDGVYYALDSFSLELLTAYAAFEKLALFDDKIGVGTLLSWPRTVAVKTIIIDTQEENNARYSGTVDAYLFLPYSKDELPLVANHGVIAHEHFHALFNKLVIAPYLSSKNKSDKKSTANFWTPHDIVSLSKEFFGLAANVSKTENKNSADENYNNTIIRGINEGLADVWAWIVTGDPKFVQRSIKTEGCRNLLKPCKTLQKKNVKSSDVESITNIKKNIKNATDDRERLAYAYSLGSLVATEIASATLEIQNEKKISLSNAKINLATSLMKSLTLMNEELVAKKESELIEPLKVFSYLNQTDSNYNVPDFEQESEGK
jgi:hypothetical protein